MEPIQQAAARTRRTQRASRGLDEPETVLEDEKPKVRTPGQGATKAAWQQTSETGLLLFTVALATLLNAPVLAMADDEAAAIGQPLGNILAMSGLNRRIGKHVKNSSDYFALTWASLLYVMRVKRDAGVQKKPDVKSSGSSASAPSTIPSNKAGVPTSEPAETDGIPYPVHIVGRRD